MGLIDFAKGVFGGKEKPIKGEKGVIGEFDLNFEDTAVMSAVNEDDLDPSDYKAMQQNDGQVQAITQIISKPIISAGSKATISPPEGQSAKKEVEFIKENLLSPPHEGGMQIPFIDVIADMTRGIFEGFRGYELVWEHLDGKYKIDKIAPRDAETLEILVTDKGEYDGLHQEVTLDGEDIDENIPKDKTLLYTHQKHKSWLYGESSLKSAYYHYTRKHKYLYLDGIRAQSAARKQKIAMLAKNASRAERLQAMNVLNKMANKHTGGVLNKDWVDEIIQIDDTTSYDIQKSIQYEDNAIAKSVLTQFINLGEGKNAGAYALSKDQSDIFIMWLEGTIKEMESVFNNQLIPKMIDYNFTSQAYPILEFGAISDKTKDILENIFVELLKKDKLPSGLIDELNEEVADILHLEWNLEAQEELDEEEDKEKKDLPQFNPENVQVNRGNIQALQDQEEPIPKVPAGEVQMATESSRPLTAAEEKANLKDLTKKMKNAETGFRRKVGGIMKQQFAEIVKDVKNAVKNESQSEIKNIKLKYQDELKEEMGSWYRGLFEFAKVGAADGLGVDAPPTKNKVEKIIDTKIQTTLDKHEQDVLFKAKALAVEELQKEVNMSVETLGEDTEESLDKYFDVTIPLMATFLVANAVNVGRDVTFQDSKDDIAMFQYSAVMDDRTTAHCSSLDGLTVTANDPKYDEYMPPQHPNCRSVWIAVGEDFKGKPSITGIPKSIPSQIPDTFKDLPKVIKTPGAVKPTN